MTNSQYLPGKRVMKTLIAVTICLIIIKFLFPTSNGFYMIVAAVLTMKVTSDRSLSYGISRMKGTFIGTIVGTIVLYIFHNLNIGLNSVGYIIINVIATFICLMSAKILKFDESASSMACVMLYTLSIVRINESIMGYVLQRFSETLVGIIVAVIVNRYVFIGMSKKENDELDSKE